MTTYKRFLGIPAFIMAMAAHAGPVGDFQIQGGLFGGESGKSQTIAIENLLGNHYTVHDGSSSNGLLGLGYLFHAINHEHIKLDAGINAFYLFDMEVSGDVLQELEYENMSYSYKMTNLPVYAEAKATFLEHRKRYGLTLNAGIGPNFMTTRNFHEKPLESGIIVEDNYSGKTTTSFSATAGIGVQFHHLGHSPVSLELGYRFFYLGEGEFDNENDSYLSTFKTGTTIANAFVVTLLI